MKKLLFFILSGVLCLNSFGQNLTSVTPASAMQGQSLSVSISGNNLHFSQATNTLVWFDQGSSTVVYPLGVNPISNNSLSAFFNFPVNQIPGWYNVNVYNEIDGFLSLPSYFVITANPTSPQIISVNPSTAVLGEVLNVTISGLNMHFNQGTGTITWFQQGSSTIIYPNNQQATSSNNLVANYSIPNNATTGYYSTYTYNDSDGLLVLNNSFLLTTPVSYLVTTLINPITGGSVTGAGYYNNNQLCTLTATANSAYYFVNWTENGNIVSTNQIYSFTVNSNRTLVANFSPINQFMITTSVSPLFSGIVIGGGAYTLNQSATLYAKALSGYYFVNWTENGNIVSLDSVYIFNVVSNRTLVANFNLIISVPEIKDHTDVYIYPNPAAEFFYVDLNSNFNDNVIIELYDFSGKLTNSFNAGNELHLKISIENLKNGIYYINIKQKNKRNIVKKLFVNN